MQYIDPIEEVWDKKKILVGILSLILAGGSVYGVKTFVLDKYIQGSVKGVSSKNEKIFLSEENKPSVTESQTKESSFSLPSSEDVKAGIQQKLDTIRQEVSGIKLEEIASSSPQIQKVINDIKSLEQYPRNQAKDLCNKICSGL